jgi:uncharacterized membrane protein YgaE (UPF0421/DUF939 family)
MSTHTFAYLQRAVDHLSKKYYEAKRYMVFNTSSSISDDIRALRREVNSIRSQCDLEPIGPEDDDMLTKEEVEERYDAVRERMLELVKQGLEHMLTHAQYEELQALMREQQELLDALNPEK